MLFAPAARAARVASIEAHKGRQSDLLDKRSRKSRQCFFFAERKEKENSFFLFPFLFSCFHSANGTEVENNALQNALFRVLRFASPDSKETIIKRKSEWRWCKSSRVTFYFCTRVGAEP